jgi:hypothetical protein
VKALKSPLAAQLLRSGVKIPLQHGATFTASGIVYTVNFVPKAHSN